MSQNIFPETSGGSEGEKVQRLLRNLEKYQLLKTDAIRACPDSQWAGHSLFGYLCTRELQPHCLVELGTFNGCSFFSFCEGMEGRNPAGSRYYAVDTWKGDPHCGYYGNEIFQRVQEYAQLRYPTLAVLKRMYFDDAVKDFSSECIDLLHIDGLHTYEAVKHDFETWLPKVRPGGLILFHDICEVRDDFGVWRFWAELKQKYAEHFEFHHFHGLGVLRKPGPEPIASELLAQLLTLKDEKNCEKIRQVFEQNPCCFPRLNELSVTAASLSQMVQQIEVERQKNIELELQNGLLGDLTVVFQEAQQPLVSIIVPCYNNYKYTRDCLLAIAIRTKNIDYEVILADDHSTDETVSAAKSFQHLRIVTNESGTKGFLHNVNYAAQFARGKYLLLLNNDTVPEENWLQPMVRKIDACNDVGAAGCVVCNPFRQEQQMGRILYHTGESVCIGTHLIPQTDHTPLLADADFVAGAAFLIRKDIWDSLKGFDPVFAPGYYEETDLCMRIRLQLGLRIVCYTGSKVWHLESKTFSLYERNSVSQLNQRIFCNRYGKYLEEREQAAVAKHHRSPLESVFLEHYAAAWNL